MTTPTGRTSPRPSGRARSDASAQPENRSGSIDLVPSATLTAPINVNHGTSDDRRSGPVTDAEPTLQIGGLSAVVTGEAALDPDVYLVGPTGVGAAQDAPAPVDGVAVLTLDDDKDEPHLIFVNDGLCELTGWRADELLGQPPTKLFARNTGRNEVQAMIRALGLDSPTDGADPGAAQDADLDILDLISLEAEGETSGPSPQERAQRMLGSMGEDLFNAGNSLFGDTSLTLLSPSPDEADDGANPLRDLDGHNVAGHSVDVSNFDANSFDLEELRFNNLNLNNLDLADGHSGRSYSSVTQLLTRDQEQVPVYFTAHMVASRSRRSTTLVCQVRDLRRATAERLEADKEAVVASLSRGHELGQLCHQIAVMVEKSLGVSSTCWILIANEVGDLEPVITGGFDPDVVAGTAAVAQSNAKPVKRVFGSASLQPFLSERLLEDGATDLWYVPVMTGDDAVAGPGPGANGRSANGEANAPDVVDLPVLEMLSPTDVVIDEPSGHEPTAAIMVATSHSSPDRKATVLLEHMAEILGTAVSHATSELNDHHQALHDPLTQLPNRALIVDRLGQAMTRLDRDGVALSVLLVDIDRFKWINDTHGVDVGDRVLVEVAERLLAAVRLGDTVGRIGSDQFLVVCVANNGELDTPAVGRRVLRAVSEPIMLPATAMAAATVQPGGTGGGTETLSITASIGAVVVNEQSERPATVIGNAESALSRASSLGRGKFSMFKAEHQKDLRRRHHLEQQLRHAIHNDELVLHYQPIVDISSGVMIGAEALLRWDHPDEGLLGPDKFMPIAEESDLMMALDRWVINDVCGSMDWWPQIDGRWPQISINLSAQILGNESLVPTICEAFEQFDLPPERLGFEITESMQVLDMQTALENLNRLAQLGSPIAIDDFGVGHASLDYLRTFSMATELKIDRSFVDGLTRSKEDTAIVTASIAMANSLGLHAVAEGVESVEQLLTLREMGCAYAQGFVLARPLPLPIVVEIWNREHLYQSRS